MSYSWVPADQARPNFVYRCYDSQDRLLYVGCTVNPRARVENHRLSAWWGDQIASVRNLVFPDRETALSKERRAIHQEMPRCNVKGRWHFDDPRESWTPDDYAIFHYAIHKAANGLIGVSTARLLRSVEDEFRLRFGYQVFAHKEMAA